MSIGNYDAATPPLTLKDDSSADSARLNKKKQLELPNGESKTTPAPSSRKPVIQDTTSNDDWTQNLDTEGISGRHEIPVQETQGSKKITFVVSIIGVISIVTICAVLALFYFTQWSKSSRTFEAPTETPTATTAPASDSQAVTTTPAQATSASSTENVPAIEADNSEDAFISLVENNIEEIFDDTPAEQLDSNDELDESVAADKSDYESVPDTKNPLTMNLFSTQKDAAPEARVSASESPFNAQAALHFFNAYNLQHSDKPQAISELNQALNSPGLSDEQRAKISQLRNKLLTQMKILEGARG